jgi:eukaryotic-like serine/threonine-protein kinase
VTDQARLDPGTVVDGKLRVVRVLGEGGMGVVYEVQHEVTRHRRALKVVRAESLADASVEEFRLEARLLREASAAGRIGSPHVVETLDVGRLQTGELYVLMELLEGESVASMSAERGPLPLVELLDLGIQACRGVQAAHDAGIVHRDLKPANLFLVSREGRPFVKILDFGVSKFEPLGTELTELTQEGHLLGTPAYMPPEQLRGERTLDRRADVYALSVILYKLASGERPFRGRTPLELGKAIERGDHVPLHEHRPDLPRALSDVIAHGMRGDRELRLASAEDLAAALERIRDEPGAPYQPPALVSRRQADEPTSVQTPMRTAPIAADPVTPLSSQTAPLEVPASGARRRTVPIIAASIAMVASIASLPLLRSSTTAPTAAPDILVTIRTADAPPPSATVPSSAVPSSSARPAVSPVPPGKPPAPKKAPGGRPSDLSRENPY